MQMSNNRCIVYGMIAAALAFAVVAPIVMVPTLSPATARAAEPGTPDAFRNQVRPLLERYCVECHGREETEAGIDLDRYGDREEAAKEKGRTWLRVRDALQGAIM